MLAPGSGTADAGPDDQCRAKVSTNLDLVVAAGVSHLVREVFIATEFVAILSPTFWWIIGRMRSAAPVWSRVDSFIVVPASTQWDMNLRRIEAGNDMTEILAIGDALAELMPGLRKLDLGVYCLLPKIGEMCGHMAGRVASQLLTFTAWDTMYRREDCRLDAIRDLRMWNKGATGWRSPRISADTLERLDMVQCIDDNLCSFIDTNSGTNRTIVFRKLKSLRFWPLSYHGTNRIGADARPYHQRLHLPALRKLGVNCYAADCLLWSSVVLPANMDSLDLSMASATCESIAQTTLPKVKHLRLKAYDVYLHTTTTTIRAIDRILVEAGGYESKMLSITDSITSVHPDSLACTGLTWLLLDGPTSVDDLLGFLQKQSRLHYLNLGRVTVGDTHADMSIPSSDDDRLVAPLHATLARLAFAVEGGREVRGKATALTTRLMLGLPALASIHASPILKRQIVDFVGEYVHRYPHLAGVNIELLF
ncbi:hypothetical protein H4R21_002352 [Coemansia helicoidea]|uniref:Uncharacterized protein n=1 Tax=Coemansia helicoidea TaxID=1286919 RepID=A0ACC1L6V1_9FUNG|nr:hypothetical protein H4R21_002352 [Coemansia helicoidea]